MTSNRARILWLLLAITASMPLWDLGHPLWEVDDARYAEVPREMVEGGNWLTPSLNYVEYLQKPPLIYWLGALSYSAFGVSEASSRIPLAILALLGIAGAWWLGHWLFSPETGLLAAIILGTSAEYSLLSHLQTPDMALTVLLLWSSAFTLRVLRRPADASWAAPAAGAAAGLAFLSKGLVGFVFPAAWAAALALLFPELRKGAKALLFGTSVPIALLVVTPWFWAMTRRHPGFLYHFFIEHHLLRFVTPEFNRPGPWYYFVGIDLAGLLPWTPLAVAACVAPLLRWKDCDPRNKQLALWVLLVLAFFSISKSKLPTYILPLFPHQCLLAAELSAGLIRRPFESRIVRGAAWALGTLALAALAVLVAKWSGWVGPLGLGAPVRATAAIFAGALLAALAAQAWWKADFVESRATWVAAAGALLTMLTLIGARQARAILSADAIASEIAAYWRPGDRIITYDFYLHGLPYYLRRRVDSIVNWKGEFAPAARDPRYAGLLLDEGAIRSLTPSSHTTFVIVRPKVFEEFMAVAGRANVRKWIRFPIGVLALM